MRARLSDHLRGSGLELGPGHSPFAPIGPGVRVRYLDRRPSAENAALFPELGPETRFTAPDIVADLDVDRLSAVADASEDFVICSHILEHLADPLGIMGDVHRVVRPGGIFLILLPDRHRTFDRHREATPLSHLVAEHEAGVTEVDDDHIVEFVWSAHVENPLNEPIPADPVQRRALIAEHRARSVHAHCWDQGEFVGVVGHAIGHLDQNWELVDAVTTAEGGPDGIEFGLVLRRAVHAATSEVTLARFNAAWSDWVGPPNRLSG